jgi:hypothetical protein
MITLREVTSTEPASITCDRCGCTFKNEPDNFGYAECLSIKHTCGYGSIVGDGVTLQADLCQQCVKEVLLPFSHIS